MVHRYNISFKVKLDKQEKDVLNILIVIQLYRS